MYFYAGLWPVANGVTGSLGAWKACDWKTADRKLGEDVYRQMSLNGNKV